MHEIDTSRPELIEEFKRNPVGRHSGDLRRLLNAMRTHPDLPPYLLVCTIPQHEWRLAVKAPGRGEPVEILEGHVYTDPLQAEWAVFKLRWKVLTGEVLEP
ncbi:MAG: hypothetical protein OEU36_03440 [Gammaproteobacteria bacterium]|nr:hypothetical protein [Gammaproteobacteria bacterium]